MGLELYFIFYEFLNQHEQTSATKKNLTLLLFFLLPEHGIRHGTAEARMEHQR
jgi:hypothetical protein